MLKIHRTNSLNYLCKTQHKCSHANVPTSLRPKANSQTLTPKVLLNTQIHQLPLVTRTIYIFTLLLDSKLFEDSLALYFHNAYY